MIKSGLLAAALFSLSQLSFASSACVTGSLSGYVALGTTGCTIGSATLSNFAVLTGITGATAISPSTITLSPFAVSGNPGLTTSVSASANSPAILEAIFTYVISGSSFGSASLSLTNSSETGDGAVAGLKDICAGGLFGPDGVSGCSGTPASLLTLDGVQNSDSVSFNQASFLSVTDDFTIDGGTAGSATAGTLTNQFNTVPEPGTILLTVAGFALTVGFRRRLTAGRSVL